MIVVTSDTDGKGVVKVDNDVVDQVNVLNNYGSLLPENFWYGYNTHLCNRLYSSVIFRCCIIFKERTK